MNQTFKNIEIICINDGSTDDSLKILKEFSDSDCRIKLINIEHEGPSCRNYGLDVATGKFISFLDSDDFFETNCLKTCLDLLSDNDMLIFETNVLNGNQDDDNYASLKWEGSQIFDNEMILNTNVYLWNKIFRKSIIDRYKIRFEKNVWYEDAQFFFNYAKVCRKVFYLNCKLHTYCRHTASIMSETKKYSPRALDHLKIIRPVYYFWEKNNFLENTDDRDTFLRIFEKYFFFALNDSPFGFFRRQVFKLGNELVEELRLNELGNSQLCESLHNQKYHKISGYEHFMKIIAKKILRRYPKVG